MTVPVRLALAALLVAAPAAAQYRSDEPAGAPFRDGQPDVLRPPPPPLDRGTMAAGDFRAAYARARSPRIMVFWNRTFSDEVTTAYRNDLHGEATSSAAAAIVAGPGVAFGASGRRDTVDISTGTTRVDHNRSAAVDEDVDFGVEAAFTDGLAGNGARLIDRSMAMRASRGARGAGSRPNLQAIESEATAARADLLIEVLQTASAGTPTGATFKVTVKDIRAARVLAAFTSGGSVAPRPARLVPGPGGFVRETVSTATSPEGVGHELADRTMAALARSLR